MLTFKEETHQYFDEHGDEVPSVTTILNYLTADHYKSINPAVLARASAKGTAVHEMCEDIDLGIEGQYESEIIGYGKGYVEFLRDYAPKWEAVEKTVFEPYDRYCGRLDRLGVIDGYLTVVDIKTTSNPTKENYMSLCCQTSAYAFALERFGEPIKRYGLFLKPDGDYKLFDCEAYEKKYQFDSWQLFKNCLILYWDIKLIKDRKGLKKNEWKMK